MTLQPSEDANGQGQVKIVVVGDGAVGKTSMIASYATNSFDDDHVPTVYDMYRCQVEVNGKKVKVDIHDTAGQEDYDRSFSKFKIWNIWNLQGNYVNTCKILLSFWKKKFKIFIS